MVQRQAQGDHRAPAQRALDVHGAVQRGHDGIHQRKADAAAAHRVAALVELGLDVLQVLRRDAAALIENFHKGFVLACPQLDRDAAAGGRIFDGVVLYDDEHLPQVVGVSIHRDHLSKKLGTHLAKQQNLK